MSNDPRVPSEPEDEDVPVPDFPDVDADVIDLPETGMEFEIEAGEAPKIRIEV